MNVVDRCAICGTTTYVVLDFGHMPLANGYAEPDRREPLTVRHCYLCDLYQLDQPVEPSALFAEYAYRTGATQQDNVWRELADAVNRRSVLNDNELVVDIGGNDGTLLGAFWPYTSRLINVDPFAPEQTEKCTVERSSWNVETAERLCKQHGAAKVITATNSWAHIPTLNESATAASFLLAQDGWLIVQAPWYRDLFMYNAWDTIYHEHVYYLGVRAMRTLFQRHFMDVHHIDYLPDVHGGSLRYWIRHGNDGIDDSVQRLGHFEDLWAGAPGNPHRPASTSLQHDFDFWRKRFEVNAMTAPQPLYAVGAAAKATMLLAMTGTSGKFTRLFDDTPAKIGKRLPGTALVVEPLDSLMSTLPNNPLVTVFLTAWNHRKALTERLRTLGYTGKVLTPRDFSPNFL